MSIARKIYPNATQSYIDGETYFETIFDYQPILDSFGKILVQVDDDNYQGDSRVFYEFEDGTFGVLQFGWGSCSGCDALLACHSYKDVDRLISELRNQIRVFKSLWEAKVEYFIHDRFSDGTMYDISSEQLKFFTKCLNLIKERL